MKNINTNKDNTYAVVNTMGMKPKKLLGLFDMIFGAEESALSDTFDSFIEDKKDMLQNSIVEQYDDLVKAVPEITDGKEMFDWWSYVWFRDSWMQDAQESNKKFIFEREEATKKYIVNEVLDNEQ